MHLQAEQRLQEEGCVVDIIIPGSVMLTHTVLRRIYNKVAITHLLHRMSQKRTYYNKYGLRPSK